MSRQDGARGLEALLLEARELVAEAKSMPLSGSALVDRDELIQLIDEALAALPEQLREARFLLRERDAYRRRSEAEGRELLDAARVQAERMVARAEVVREAELHAKRVIARAEDDARRLRHEAEEYCDQRLATLQDLLERTMRSVDAGRAHLASTTEPASGRPAEQPELPEQPPSFASVFDQDDSEASRR